MNPNCRIGTVTFKKPGLHVIPTHDEDVEPYISSIREFVARNGCTSVGFFVCGRGGLTRTGYTGNLQHGAAGASALHAQIVKDWFL